MSGTTHLARKALGLLLALVGVATLLADVQVAYLEHRGLHVGHMVVSMVLIFVGGLLLDTPTAESVADAILKRVPIVAGLWPGGLRRGDPPSEPGVPLPPSVTEGTGIIYGSGDRPKPPPPKDCP